MELRTKSNKTKLAWEATEREKLRKTAVHVMNIVLRCWTRTTGKSRYAFAEEIGFLQVPYNQNETCRAQTLGQDLQLSRLPLADHRLYT